MSCKDDWEEVPGATNAPSGGQGVVRKVRNRHDGRLGALKIMHADKPASRERRARMHGEATALKALAGAGVPALLAANTEQWEQDGTDLFIVMEWIEGLTLAQAVSRGALDIDTTLAITQVLLRTVAKCHEANIHHRDLKPDNVVLRDGDLRAPVIVDFGMSWAKPDGEDGRKFETDAGQELGNRFLRLPEHAAGVELRDLRSDISMVVGLLFFMLTGRAPRQLLDVEGRFPHEVHADAFAEATTSDLRWAKLRRVFKVGFQPTFGRRFQTAKQLTETLDNLAPDLGTGDERLRVAAEQIQEVLTSPEARAMEQDLDTMREAMQRFERIVRSEVQEKLGSGFGVSTRGSPAAIDSGIGLHDSYAVIQHGPANPPQAACQQVLRVESGEVIAEIADIGPGSTGMKEYYRGPISNDEALFDAAERQARQALTRLLEVLLPQIKNRIEKG